MNAEAREAMQRQHDDDRADAYLEWCHQRDAESVEAVEGVWAGSHRQQAGHFSSSQHWDGSDGSRLDRRLFGVDAAVADGEQVERFPTMGEAS